MEQNIAWNYPKGLINFITAFILIQAIVMGILIFLYADSFFDINEGDGIIIPDELFVEYFKNEAKQSFISKAGLLLLKPALKRFKYTYDYAAYGGAPLLGLNGVSIIAHGKSSPLAIKNAIKSAYHAIDSQMVSKIAGAVNNA